MPASCRAGNPEIRCQVLCRELQESPGWWWLSETPSQQHSHRASMGCVTAGIATGSRWHWSSQSWHAHPVPPSPTSTWHPDWAWGADGSMGILHMGPQSPQLWLGTTVLGQMQWSRRGRLTCRRRESWRRWGTGGTWTSWTSSSLPEWVWAGEAWAFGQKHTGRADPALWPCLHRWRMGAACLMRISVLKWTRSCLRVTTPQPVASPGYSML